MNRIYIRRICNFSFHLFRQLKYSLAIFFCLIFFDLSLSGQEYPDPNLLSEKALLFKNRVEYDSAIYYYQLSGEIFARAGDQRSVILNRLNIYDLYILRRDFPSAQSGLQEAATEIQKNYTGEDDLISDLFQVKGSYLLATGQADSAKTYLAKSIRLRIDRHGKNDTLLHYAYNKLGNLYLAKSDYDSAYIFHQAALELSGKKQNKVNYLTASSYQNLGIAAHMKGDFQMAETCYTRSLELKEKLFNYNDPALAKIYGNLGKFYTDLSKYDMALEYYDKAEESLITRYDRNNLQFAHIYWNKGNVYTHKGDYIKSISYLTKALSIFEANLGPDNQDVLKVLQDLGFAFNEKGDTLLAIDYYHKAAKDTENAGIIKIYRNLGNIYQEINKPDSADKYYKLSIDYAKKIFSGNSYDLALCYQYYGEFLSEKGNDPNSLWYFSQASDIFKQIFGSKNKDLSNVYSLQSEYYLLKSEYDSALNKIQAALVALLPEFSDNNPYENPLPSDFTIDIYLQNELLIKAIIHYKRFKKYENIRDLIASLDVINLTIELIQEIRKTINDEESQIILNNSSRHVFDLGVLVSLELYSKTLENNYLYKAFQYNEKGKAIILLSALRGLDAQAKNSITENIMILENGLRKGLATYNDYLNQEKRLKDPDKAKMKLWSDKIFSIRLTYDSLLSTYKESYPEYYRLKYDYSVISADSALAGLPDDRAILEYYISDSVVFGFVLTDRKISARKLGSSLNLNRNLDSLHRNFSRSDFFNAGQDEFETITSISSELYNFLILPFEEQIEGKRLIIIPDGKLGYLSFDLLLKEKPDVHSMSYKDLHWLIRSNPVSYSSSATIYFEQTRRVPQNISGNLLAFAPSYDFESMIRNAGPVDSAMLKLGPIIGTREEINSISGLLRTKKLFNGKATETYFKEHAGEYGILHLAMHTIINNENPLYSKLVFTPPEKGSRDDGYLNTYELFGMQLTGQLAVLSACNTGGGKLERGEGIISLARGFFYSGIPSVVMTLWEIEDHSSADLMAIFYKNLKQGLPTDIALQQAKLAYLETSGKLKSHPYFWAGYVSIGKTEPVSFRNGFKPFSIILTGMALIIIIGIIFLFINRRVFFHKKRY
jgi:CHAT domain-containing protein/tetratricopeptide (TPR) repeat protein